MNAIPTPQNNNMMDMMKSQLMTVMMMKSMNNNEKGQDNGMFTMLYVFILTGLIDFICKTVAPSAINKFNEYYKNKMKNTTDLLQNMTTSKDSIKSSSVTIQIKISDHENIYGQSLLDYITNNNNTKHITYKKQNFILNQKDIIEICDDLFVNLKENKMTEAATDKTPQDLEQTIELFSYKKTTHELRTFLNKLSYDYELKMKNKLGDHIYYFNQHPMNVPADSNGNKDLSKLPSTTIFTMKKFQTNRKFSNLFGPEIDIVKKRVEFFIKNKKWYDEKGIPYTIGLLLSGQAGAGKTSSIKCLANETNRHIININLNNDITKTQFENLFFNEVISVLNTSTGQTEKYSIPLDQRIYVLEDIDCQSDLVMERSLKKPLEKKEEQQPNTTSIQSVKTNPNKPDTYNNTVQTGCEKLDLSHLLNVLDGVLETPGRIVIMTSNYIDKLDHALIRPGRIDIIANFKKCVNKTLIEMIEFFYDISLTENDKKRILALKEYIVSPAEMGKVMFENFDNFRNTIETLEKMHRNNHEEEMLSQFYSKHGRMPVHDDGFYVYGSEDDHKYQMAVEAMINRNKTDIIDVRNKSELSEKVEKEEVENEEFINIKDIPNETPEDIYLTRTLDTAKLEIVKDDIDYEDLLKKQCESTKIILNRQQEQQRRNYSITSTNKAYGENDSLEIFDPTQVFSSRVSVF